MNTKNFEPPMNANPESARGLAQSKTLRAVRESRTDALRFGVRRPSAAFRRAFSPWMDTDSFLDRINRMFRIGFLFCHSVQPATALRSLRSVAAKAPEGWRSPRRFAPFVNRRQTLTQTFAEKTPQKSA